MAGNRGKSVVAAFHLWIESQKSRSTVPSATFFGTVLPSLGPDANEASVNDLPIGRLARGFRNHVECILRKLD
jgi:hypothetical protein